MIASFTTTKSQSYINDDNWELVSSKSDEFDGTTLDATKWESLNIFTSPAIGCNWGGGSCFTPNNVSLDSGLLKLKVSDRFNNGNNYYYFTGGIESLNFDYGYGYYEMSAKLPGFNYNGSPSGNGFWPAFWLWYSDPHENCTALNEIDILDPGCSYADGKTIGPNWHNLNFDDCSAIHSCPNCFYNTGDVLYNGFHKFGVEWLPEKLIFYFDGIPYRSTISDPTVADHFQRLIIDLQMLTNPPTDNCGVKDHSKLPLYMRVDYFRYYQFKMDCSNDATIYNNTDFQNFIFKVKRNITIGNGSSSIALNSSDKKIFRATTSITINGDFTAPLGSELSLIPTTCIVNTSNSWVPPSCY